MKMGKVTGTVVTKKYKGSGHRAQGAGHSFIFIFIDSHAAGLRLLPRSRSCRPYGAKNLIK